MGLSFRMIRPSLPGIVEGALSAANAAGIKPAGINRANGIVIPRAALIVISPDFFKNPRRLNLLVSLPQIVRSAAIGS